ncbi:MAG TPA: isoprenylcysteine carboxylmethyltransferase family protein [Terriglobales bacterium]|nr:isoprenylcysteine carboxylmethyltransferase family protein [Terriglobales bacterium]
MTKTTAILVSAIFAVIAPGTVAGIVPWWISRWKLQAPFLHFYGFRVIGVVLIVAGLPVLLDSFARFALQGFGTPAPVFPTRHLVVTGLYHYVRNPMYVAVIGLIAGQALLLGNRTLLSYGIVVWLCFHAFVLFYEEPVLRKKYAAEYEEFCQNVPRWIPCLRPWNASRPE